MAIDSRALKQEWRDSRARQELLNNDYDLKRFLLEFVERRFGKKKDSEIVSSEGALGKAALTEKLLGRCHENGICRVKQLQALSLQGRLNEVLQSIGVAQAIEEYFDKDVAEERRKKKFASFWLSLSGNIPAMESTCVNYGLVSALILTMTFANFSSITAEDWQEYFLVCISETRCQTYTDACEDDISENHLGWGQVRCHGAAQLLLEDPTTNLTMLGRDCCLPAIDCAKGISYRMQLAHTLGNGGGSATLLLVVLATAWLYIALHASKTNKSRYEEAKILQVRLREEFLLLHFLFLVGIITACTGLSTVMTMKVEDVTLSYVVWFIGLIGSTLAGLTLVWILWEIFFVNKAIDILREKTEEERHKYVEEMEREGATGYVEDLARSPTKAKTRERDDLSA